VRADIARHLPGREPRRVELTPCVHGHAAVVATVHGADGGAEWCLG
jgi:hypothetical protein